MRIEDKVYIWKYNKMELLESFKAIGVVKKTNYFPHEKWHDVSINFFTVAYILIYTEMETFFAYNLIWKTKVGINLFLKNDVN